MGGISYGSGGTSTNRATFENSYYALKGESSGDRVCDAGAAVFTEVFTEARSSQAWATAQDRDHFGLVLTDRPGGSGCSSAAMLKTSNELSIATHCAGMFVYVAGIDPAAAAGKGVKTYQRKVGSTDVSALVYVLGTDGLNEVTSNDLTDCGASHSYEFITLMEEDKMPDKCDIQDWEAAACPSLSTRRSPRLSHPTRSLCSCCTGSTSRGPGAGRAACGSGARSTSGTGGSHGVRRTSQADHAFLPGLHPVGTAGGGEHPRHRQSR